MRQIITLVGTSVLTNGRRELKLKDPDAGQLLDYLHGTDETRGSAETNSLQHLLREDDGIIFVHSDTPEGRLCAEVLDRFYSDGRHGRARVLVNAIELCVVPQLNYSEKRFKLVGLRALVNTLSTLIRREERAGREVLAERYRRI